MRRAGDRGFTLLEVVISLAILAISLMMLLTINASSLSDAGRARDLTIATLLARSKMIDLEQMLFDEGFTEGDQNEEGDFGDEGHPDIKWEAEIIQVELDISGLSSMCEGFGGDSDLGAIVEAFIEDDLGGEFVR